jgi:MFS family permease
MLDGYRDASVVLKYYLYRAVGGPGFIWPVYVLYLLAHDLSYAAIGAIGAVQTVVVLASEVPTGYVGDRIGRRDSLAVAQVVFTVSAVGMVLADDLAGFAASFALLSFAMTFTSGTADAWLYEMLEERLDEDDFTHVKGRGSAVGKWATASTMVVGGLLYVVEPVYPFVAVVGARLVTLAVVLTLPRTGRYADDGVADGETEGQDDGPADDGDETLPTLQTPTIVREHLLSPELRAFVGYMALFVAAAATAGIFIQPITVEALQGEVGALLATAGVPEAATLGVLYASFTGVSALASDRASDLEAWLGTRRALLVVPLLVSALFVLPLAVPLLAFPMFFGMKAGQSVVRPISGQYLNDHLADVGRATVLSAVSMVFALTRIPFVVGSGVLADWTTPLTAVAAVGAGFLVAGGALLALGSPVEDKEPAAGAGATKTAAD